MHLFLKMSWLDPPRQCIKAPLGNLRYQSFLKRLIFLL